MKGEKLKVKRREDFMQITPAFRFTINTRKAGQFFGRSPLALFRAND